MKRRKKTGRVISRGKPPTNSVEAFLRRYTVEKELRSGMVVRDEKTNRLLKVYGDKHGETVAELYTQR
jgi:hypothetical protein